MIRYRRNLDRKLFHLGALLRGSEMASSWIAASAVLCGAATTQERAQSEMLRFQVLGGVWLQG